jgi:hypothetical protein
MAAVPDKIQTWQMVQPTTRDKESGEVTPGKIEKTIRTWGISMMGFPPLQNLP